MFALWVRAVDLDELREIDPILQAVRDRGPVGREAIAGKLVGLSCGSGPETFNENVRGGLVPSAKSEVQNQLAVALDCHEAIGIADSFVVRFRVVLVGFLFANEAPDLINLDILYGDVDDQPAHELFAPLASQHQKPKDRITVDGRKALAGTDCHPLQEQIEHMDRLMHGEPHFIKRTGVRFGVGPPADPASIASESVPMLAEALAFRAAAGYFRCLHLAVHKSIIQQAPPVCQQQPVDFSREMVYKIKGQERIGPRVG